MTIAEQAKAIKDALSSWARENAGAVRVAGDAFQAFDVLRSKPGGVVAVVLFDSEDPRGDYSELGRVDRNWKVLVSRGKGLRLDSGETFTDGSAGGRPLFNLVEEAREVVRAVVFEEEEAQAEYEGCGPYEVQGFILDAFELRFSVGTQIPDLHEQESE